MKNLILALAIVVAIAALVAAGFYGPPACRHYKEARGLRQAGIFLAAGDLENASVSARQVLQVNPNNVEACCIMAGLAEACHSPATIDWRQRVADLAPTVSNRLKLVACALRFERPPYALAGQALRQLEPVARGIPAFHVLSAELALRLNAVDEAAAQFQEAARLEPANPLHQLNLAVLQLRSTHLARASTARRTLEQLSTNDAVGPLALRWLVADHLRGGDLTGAKDLSSRLLADPRAQLDDRLQHLTILQRTQSFREYLKTVQSAAATNSSGLFSVCEWMGSHGLANDALTWLAGLDAKRRQAQPVPLAQANLYLAKTDWPALDSFLRDQKWADLEFLRLALLARAAWGQNRGVIGDTCWASAARAGADRLGSLALLLGLATDWDRDPADLLWQIGKRFPREQWAWRELERRYAAAGNTRGLNNIYSAWLDSQAFAANDLTNQNNFATTSMLLQVNLPRAYQTARDLYRQNPADPILASTYAYSLHLQGRTRDGLAVMAQVNREALAAPPLALYYGVLLAASGDTDRAGRYLALAGKANLLPEEKALLRSAKKEF